MSTSEAEATMILSPVREEVIPSPVQEELVLSPVREECLKRDHDSERHHNVTCQAGITANVLRFSLSVVWWSTAPVRNAVAHVAENFNPETVTYINEKTLVIRESLAQHLPVLDDDPNKALRELRQTSYHKFRCQMRGVIRSGIGRRVLRGLDHVITVSDILLDYLGKEATSACAVADNKQEAEVGKMTSNMKDDGKARTKNDSAEGNADGVAIQGDLETNSKATMTSPGPVFASPGPVSTSPGSVSTMEAMQLKVIVVVPLKCWVGSLKRMRRYLYRIGRLRRCRRSTRTPAKKAAEIDKRPKASPKKRIATPLKKLLYVILSPMVKGDQLSPDLCKKEGKIKRSKKRKFQKVSPYSAGDDSGDDVDQEFVDMFELHDYDSQNDSDWQSNSSDDPTTDSQEYLSEDTVEEGELKEESKLILEDNRAEAAKVKGTSTDTNHTACATPVNAATPVVSGSAPGKSAATPVVSGSAPEKAAATPVVSGSAPGNAGTPLVIVSTPDKASFTPVMTGSGKEVWLENSESGGRRMKVVASDTEDFLEFDLVASDTYKPGQNNEQDALLTTDSTTAQQAKKASKGKKNKIPTKTGNPKTTPTEV